MDAATATLILQAALKWGPVIAQQIATLFSKPTHSIEDWTGIFDKIKDYETLDSESKARVGAPPA